MSIGRSREDYLKAIYVLQEQTGHVRGADVARRLHISAPSVSAMLDTLATEGYVEKSGEPPRALRLTEKGSHVARQVYDRNCFFRELLRYAGVDGETADREACELEHAISPESFHLLRRALFSGKNAK